MAMRCIHHMNPDGCQTTILLGEGAFIGEEVEIGEEVRIDEWASIGESVKIGEGVKIGEEVRIGEWAIIGEGVKIGEGVRIGEAAFIDDWVEIGEGVKIGEGVRIGKWVKTGKWVKIDEDVKIGEAARIGESVEINHENYLDLGYRRDGYRFSAYIHADDLWITAGCHALPLDAARKHWGSPDYRDRGLGAETLSMIDHAERVFRLRGFRHVQIQHAIAPIWHGGTHPPEEFV